MTANDPPRCPCGHEAFKDHDEDRGCWYCLCMKDRCEAASAALKEAIDDCEGCASPEIADTGNAMIGCLYWAIIAFTVSVLLVIWASVTG